MRLVFLGSPEEVIPPLQKLFEGCHHYGHKLVAVVSQPPRPSGRSSQLIDPPVAAWAKSHQILCLQPLSAKSQDFLNELRRLKPDLMITAAYGQILSDDFLKIPTRGTINIHPSALPKYRGAIPVPAALLDGLTETAVTILFTVKKLDAGHIISSKTFAISPDEKAGDLTRRLFEESSALIFEALDKLSDKAFTGTPQNDHDATVCKKIHKESGLINWNQPAKAIYNQFRAFHPWPGSFTFLADRRVSIEAMALSHDESSTSPGTFIWDKGTKSLKVSCGDLDIMVSRLKPAGGKTMDAAGFWNGLKDKKHLLFKESPTAP